MPFLLVFRAFSAFYRAALVFKTKNQRWRVGNLKFKISTFSVSTFPPLTVSTLLCWLMFLCSCKREFSSLQKYLWKEISCFIRRKFFHQRFLMWKKVLQENLFPIQCSNKSAYRKLIKVYYKNYIAQASIECLIQEKKQNTKNTNLSA